MQCKLSVVHYRQLCSHMSMNRTCLCILLIYSLLPTFIPVYIPYDILLSITLPDSNETCKQRVAHSVNSANKLRALDTTPVRLALINGILFHKKCSNELQFLLKNCWLCDVYQVVYRYGVRGYSYRVGGGVQLPGVTHLLKYIVFICYWVIYI